MKLLSAALVLSSLALAFGSALADDQGLGKKKGGGGGGGSQSGGGSSGGGNRGGGGGGGQSGGGSSGGGNRGGGGGTSGGGGGHIEPPSRGGGGGSSGGGRGDRDNRNNGGGSSQGGGGTTGGGVSTGGGRGDRDNRNTGGGTTGGGQSDAGGKGRGDRDNRNTGGGGTQSGGGVRQGGGTGGGGQVTPPDGRDWPGRRGGEGTSRGTAPTNNSGPGSDDGLAKKHSRSGNVNYGTVNNTRQRVDRSDPITIGRVPINLSGGSLANQVRREDRIRLNGNIRYGYYHYNRRWCDDYFYYPYYAFDPWQSQCVFSPWYYYVSLPPYLSCSRIVFVSSYIFNPFVGTDYRWSRPNYNGYGSNYSSLDYAIDDIETAFKDNDRRAAGRLVPRQGGVAILQNGRYAYSLNPDDFYDMLMDAADNTRTRRYKIVDVKRRADTARVIAEHQYEDPWGRVTCVYHYIRLDYERGGYVIREFGTSDSRW